jgi:hypothetical protein
MPQAPSAWTPPAAPAQQWSNYQQGWSPTPGYGAAPYYGQAADYGSSPLATISGVLLLVVGGIVLLLGVGILLMGLFAGLIAGSFLESIDPSIAVGGGGLLALIAIFGLVILLIGILEVAAAIGIFIHKSWARWTGIVIGTIGLILGFFMLVGAMFPRSPDGGDLVFSLLWVAANGFIVAALAVANEHFQIAYPRR